MKYLFSKRHAFISFLLLIAMSASAQNATLDTQSGSRLQHSIQMMQSQLSEDEQQAFSSALAVIYTTAATRSMVDDLDIYQVKKQLDAKLEGMTAQEVIEFSQQLLGAH